MQPLTDEEIKALGIGEVVWMVTKPHGAVIKETFSYDDYPGVTKIIIFNPYELDRFGRPMLEGRGVTWRWFFKNYWDAYAWWVKYAKASEEN